MLGFERVYDYVPGKVDWLARGLPTEGERADETRVGDLARDDVVTCSVDARAADVRERVAASPYGFALVTAGEGTLIGRLRGSALREADDDATAEQLMDAGPSTVRPDLAVGELLEKLEDKDLKTAIVSTPEGKVIGVVTRDALSACAK
jgi:CBS domain containing-hemolysin-like protein